MHFPGKLLHSALLMVALMFSAPSEATTLYPLSIEQMTDASEWIVRGTITEVWTDMDSSGQIWTHAQLEVGQTLKGDPTDRALVLDQVGGIYRDELSLIEGVPRFSVGEEGLFFLERSKTGRILVVGWMQGKYTIRIDPDTGEEMLVRFAPRIDIPYDHRFIPHPAPSARIDYDEMIDQIEARLELGWDGHPIPGASTEKLSQINKLQPGVNPTRPAPGVQ